jgi:hydroxypyruvate isomerase
MKLAPNLELLFTEKESMVDRIQAAHELGFTEVELWMTSMHPVDEMAAKLTELGMNACSVLAEPRTNFTLPGTDLTPFYEGLDLSIANAIKLGSKMVVMGSGIGFPGKKRQPQLDLLVEVFTEAVKRAEDNGITLILEPVNTRVDHPGALLDRTSEAVYIANGVASDNFKILYDVYHSSVEGENPVAIIDEFIDSIGYIQLADAPGRGEPGSGQIDFTKVFTAIQASGYQGTVGLEYYPTKETASSLSYVLELAKKF